MLNWSKNQIDVIGKKPPPHRSGKNDGRRISYNQNDCNGTVATGAFYLLAPSASITD